MSTSALDHLLNITTQPYVKWWALIPYRETVTLPDMNSAAADSSGHAEATLRFLQGDRRGFNDLYYLHARELLAFLVARLKNRNEAEDVLQDVWLKVWAKQTQFIDGSFRGWVFSIARTTLVDSVRKKNRRQEVADVDDGNDPAVEDDSASDMLRKEELLAFGECLDEVGGTFVEVFRMVKVENKSPEAVADTLKVTRGTIDTRVHKGKQQLKDCVEKKLQ
ncbi:MAG: RNA polymerase sigma factor [Fuerstiella sp.]